jgi:flagellar secretion chaperone FliS
MTAYSPANRLSAYRNTAAHGGVAAADPHALILMLLNGTVERISAARGCIQNKAFVEKAQLIHRAVSLIDQLRSSLNLASGGSIAENLDNLYEYMSRQLLHATIHNDVKTLDEVLKLLHTVRGAWVEMPRQSPPVQQPGMQPR